MIRQLLILLLLITGIDAYSQFGLYASAAFINVNGTSSFYNNTAPGLGQDIGSSTYQGTNLGVFEQNSGNLKLVGAEIKTFKGIADNVCSGTLNFTIYITGSRPASPVYTPIDLGFYSDCFAPACGSFFGSYNIAAGGGCCSDRDQKWQSPGFGTAANIDLTANPVGDYTLEMYYSYTGEDGGTGCGTTKFDNNNNDPTNYTGSFTITAATPVSFGNISVTNNQTFNKLYWNTFSESNTSIFKLERSADGLHFYPLAELPAAGFSSTVRLYSLPDMDPIKGLNYYRVRMVETGGREQYSLIVKTTNRIKSSWYVQGNPVKDNIQVIGIEKGDEINIYNTCGAKIYSNKALGNYISIPVTHISNGHYYIKIMNKKDLEVLPILINH
jgi:hypothetical protein